MKTLAKSEVERLVKKRYGEKVSFEDGVNLLKKEYLCTVVNRQKSKRKKYAICESILK